jgi:HEAT repeat protein
MAHGRGWKRAALGLGLLAAAAGTWGWVNRADLGVRYAARQLARATTDEARVAWAARLLDHGDAATGSVVGFVTAGTPEVRAAVVPVVEKQLTDRPDGDSSAAALAEALLDGYAACDAGGQDAVVSLLPALLKRTGPTGAARCKAVTAAGLKLPSPPARLSAIRAAMHPLVKLRAEVVPLLAAAEPEVRRAALFAVGPATDDEPVIGDEELFRWLHDPDAGVRRVCQDALASRGRTDADVRLGRRLTNPDPAERLDLLIDLRSDDDVPDPEPWLERLARDANPGVRAGAARVAAEVASERRQVLPPWVARLADADPEPTVRRIAGYYRTSATRTDNAVRPAGGP